MMKALLFSFLFLNFALANNSCQEVKEIQAHADFLIEKGWLSVHQDGSDFVDLRWTLAASPAAGIAAGALIDRTRLETGKKLSQLTRDFVIKHIYHELEVGKDPKDVLKKVSVAKELAKLAKRDKMSPLTPKLKTKKKYIKPHKKISIKAKKFFSRLRGKIQKASFKKNKYTILLGTIFTGVGIGINYFNVRFEDLGEDIKQRPEDIIVLEDPKKIQEVCSQIATDENTKIIVEMFLEELKLIRNIAESDDSEQKSTTTDDSARFLRKEGEGYYEAWVRLNTKRVQKD